MFRPPVANCRKDGGKAWTFWWLCPPCAPHLVSPLLVTLAFASLATARSANAAFHTVCSSGCDFTTIGAAVQAADFNDTLLLEFELPQVHTEEGITITKNLTIRGRGRDLTVIQAAASVDEATSRIFEVRSGASVFLYDMTLRHGNSGLGGAVWVHGTFGLTSDLTAQRVRFTGNRASTNGGGLNVDFFATAILRDTLFDDNEAAFGGGLCSCGGDTALTESLIHENVAETGGGIGIGNGTFFGGNLTITGNVATERFGGVHNSAGVGSLRHATIVGNSAPDIGGISEIGLGLDNTVIANNPGGDCALNGRLDGWDSDGSCNPTVGTGDPRLLPLADNGGPTWTMAPREDSPLLDAALDTCPGFDQRGLERTLGGAVCDLGAYERYELQSCESPIVPIPDGDADGIVRTFLLGSPGGTSHRILDVNVSVWIEHPYVGDLTAELSHLGIRVPLIDRPGVPAAEFGCSRDDVLATLDSAAADPVENECSTSGFAIGGRFRPNGSLNAFNRRAGGGFYGLRVADEVGGFAGELLSWCLYVELFDEPPETPIFADGFETGDLSAWSTP